MFPRDTGGSIRKGLAPPGRSAYTPLVRALPLLFALASGIAFAAPPAEVPRDATFGADRATLAWTAVSGAEAYHVYRGEAPSSYDHACRVYRSLATSALLPETPPAGALFYYFVSAVNAEGEGILGTDSSETSVPNLSPCADGDGDLVADNLDNCPLVANPAQADQNEDGIGDRCDAKTYDFESDAPGQHPAGMTRVGPVAQALTVKDYFGDRAISFDQAGAGAHERFDRLDGGTSFLDTTVWLDFEEGPLYGTVELWSDGAHGWNAGGGLIVQLSGVEDVRVYQRRGNQVPLQDFRPAIPAGGRVRLRLLKGPGTESTLHLDSWDGTAFVPDWGVWTVADDRLLRGLSVVVQDYFGGPRRFTRVTVEHAVPSGLLTLRKDFRGSSDWKVFQRDALDRASIPVRFFHRLDVPGRVEARVVVATTGAVVPGHDYPDHALPLDPAPAGAAGEIVLLDVPAGGNYDVQIRLVRASDGAVLATGLLDEVAVGDVFLAGGQSNMSGYSGNLNGAEAPVDTVHLFGNDYRWKRAVEPMDDGTDQVDLVSSESPLHSLMLRFGKEIAQARGVPVGIIPGPLGGTNLFSQWQRNAAQPADRGTLYGSLLHRGLAQGYAAPVKGFLWYQGESDVGRSDYEANLKQLVSQYRADLSAPGLFFGIVQLATNFGANLNNWVGLQEQQRRVVETTPATALVATVDQPRSDTIHLSVEGYKTVGVRLARELREHLYGEAIDASARLLKATVVGNNRRIELEYDRDVTGGHDALYRVSHAGAPVTVRNVSTSGRIVTLGLGGQVATGATVSYGYSWEPAAAWLKDLAGTPVPCFKDYPTTP